MNVLHWPLRYPRVVAVLCCLLLGLGVFSLLTMPRRSTPRIEIHQSLVILPYPGADAAQVERQVTQKVEPFIFTYPEVDQTKTHSLTRDGLAVITVELHPWVADKQGFWSKLRLGLAEFKAASLPAAVIGPIVNSDFGDTVVLLVAVEYPGGTYEELRRHVDRIEDALRTIDGIGRTRRYGDQPEAIYVTADSERLARYGLGVQEVARVLALQNTIPYTGNLESGALRLPLHTAGLYSSAEEVRRQVVFVSRQGGVVRIGDVAEVARRPADAKEHIRVNGADTPVILLSIEMQPGYNLVRFGKHMQAALRAVAARLPPALRFHTVNDLPGDVAKSVNDFIREFFIAIGAVVLVTLALLPLRVALIAALAIPLTIAITFSTLHLLGVELHEVSLASLIVVLGMVVDDAIVITDNYLEKLTAQHNRWEAAWRGAAELIVPIFTATLAIIVAFAPILFFLKGSVGEFIQALPITVAVALSASFGVAMLVTPLLCYWFIPGEAARGEAFGVRVLFAAQSVYGRLIRLAVRHPQATCLAAVVSVAAGVGLLAIVPQKFFPQAEREQFVIEVDLPLGARLDATDRVVRRLEQIVCADPRATEVAAFVGTAAPRVYYSFAPEFPRQSYGMLLVNTRTVRTMNQLVAEWSRTLPVLVPEARVSVQSFQQGIPVKAPVELRLIGPDLPVLENLGAQLLERVRRVPGATQVCQDFRTGSSVTVNVDSEVANRLGLATSVIASEVLVGFEGYPVSQLWENGAPLDIVLRLKEGRRSAFNDLGDFMLRSPVTNAVLPLRQVATLAPRWQTGQIAHRNGMRTLTVRGFPETGLLASTLLHRIRGAIRDFAVPPGYKLEIGGEDEGQRETFGDMTKALGASVMLLFLILLFQFRSSRKAVIVMLAIPLTLFGAILGLFLTGNPFGFTAFVGLTSLVGIVIRNSIILVDHADELRAAGRDRVDAAISAGERRLRPIFLTSMAAAVGVVPMIISGSPLWSPLASTICVGVICSMLMTLAVIPVVYILAAPAPAAPPPEES